MILVRPFTDANDVSGFHAAKGILTSEGGKASHAALVARGMGRPAVVGVDALTIDVKSKTISVNGTVDPRGRPDRDRRDEGLRDDRGRAARRGPGRRRTSRRCSTWADELRRLGVRANADTPDDAQRARESRRRGHRAVPDRAHVHGRGPAAEDARDDHGQHARGSPGGARAAAPAPAAGLRGPVRGDGGAAGHDPPARSAAARVPAEPRRPLGAGRARTRHGEGRCRARPGGATGACRSSRSCSRESRRSRGEPDARHPRVPAGDPLSGDLRDAGRGDPAGGQVRRPSRRTRRS